jgi:hypothetical protein
LVRQCVITHQSHYGVKVEHGGRGRFQKNVIHSNGHCSFYVAGEGSDPCVEGNEIAGNTCAMRFTRQGSGSVRGNAFCNIPAPAIEVNDAAAPVIQKNTFVECFTAIRFFASGGGTAKNNAVTKCTRFGFVVEGYGSEPTIMGNEVTHNIGSGMLITDEGANPEVSANLFAHNQQHGVEMQNRCGGKLIANTIEFNAVHGICASNNAKGFAEQNLIRENKKYGVFLQSGAETAFTRNAIRNGAECGVGISSAKGYFTHNRIQENRLDGVRVVGDSSPEFVLNEIVENWEVGVVFVDDGKGVLITNIIARNHDGGVRISGRWTKPTISGNFLKKNYGAAIRIDQHASGTIDSNVIVMSEGCGISIASFAQPHVIGNVIAYHSGEGIRVEPDGGGSILDSIIAMCDGPGLRVMSSAQPPRIRNCAILKCQHAIVAEDKGRAIIHASYFLGQFEGTSAVTLDPSSSLVFDSCCFIDQKVAVHDRGCASLNECFFSQCSQAIVSEGSGKMSNCEIRDCHTGVYCSSGSMSVEGCTIINQAKHGIFVTGTGAPQIQGSILSRNRFGATWESGAGALEGCECFNNHDTVQILGGQPRIKNCTIYDGTNCGIIVKDGSPTITGNLIFDHYNASVSLDGGGGVLEDNRIYFARDDGAVYAQPSSQTNQIKNSVRNNFSPVREKPYAERLQIYKRQENEKGTNVITFRKFAKSIDSATAAAFRTVLGKVPAVLEITRHRAWMLDEYRHDVDEDLLVSPQGEANDEKTDFQSQEVSPTTSPTSASRRTPTDDKQSKDGQGDQTVSVAATPRMAKNFAPASTGHPVILCDPSESPMLQRLRDQFTAFLDNIRTTRGGPTTAAGEAAPPQPTSPAGAPSGPPRAQEEAAMKLKKSNSVTNAGTQKKTKKR